MSYKTLFKELETQIQQAYTEGVTVDEAERLAGKTLHAQIMASQELQAKDLDSRMRKSGLKAVRAAVYMDEVSKADKKPTESALDHLLSCNEMVVKEQDGYDMAETQRDELERQYNILKEAHIFFRGVAKGRFE